MTSHTASPTDHRTLIRMLDGGRGIALLLLALLLLGIFAGYWRDALVLTVSGETVEARIEDRWSERRRFYRNTPGLGYWATVNLVRFQISRPGATPISYERKIDDIHLWRQLEPGNVVPASRSRLLPHSIATVETGPTSRRFTLWLGAALIALAGLLWRRRALARQADCAIEARARGTPVAARIVSHRVHKGFIQVQLTLAWRSADGENGATLPLPGNRAALARRWPVTGSLTLWRHPDGKGRLWSEAELFR